MLALAVVLVGLAVAWFADRVAALRRPGGERGDFWSRVVLRLCVVLVPPLLLSLWLETLWSPYYRTGRHLLLDRTGAFGWTPQGCYPLALLLPVAVWLALLLWGLVEKPGGREKGRWLAGTIGLGRSRLWILLCAVPLTFILVTSWGQLGGGAAAYPGAAWSTLALLTLSLAGVALSTGRAPAAALGRQTSEDAGRTALPPWPEALRAQGLELEPLGNWAGSPPPRPVRGEAARDLADRLHRLGARGVAPELVEAVAALLAPQQDGGPGGARLVLGADGSGQTEAVALAARLLDQRYHALTLVITAAGAAELAARLTFWLPAGSRAAAIGRSGEVPAEALIWVVDAAVLSQRLLPMLKDPQLVKTLGLVVWWHLEQYTGVMAANLWAISRRLHRLIQARGRHDVRTLALVRSAPHGAAQIAGFVRQLLPHPLPPEAEVHLEPRFARAVHLHRIESHLGYFQRGAGRNIQERHRHLALVAAKVSAEAGWPTHLELPAGVAETEARAFLQLPAVGSVLEEALAPSPAAAGACILEPRPAEVLSLAERVAQGGRATADGLPHHVGLLPGVDPYVAYLLADLGNGVLSTSRRLVGAGAHPSIVRRHLLLALNEMPDTHGSLRDNFLWHEEEVRYTLEEISREGKLARQEVRFLDENDRLQVDHEYTSWRLPGEEERPLDTVGVSLVAVRERAGGHEERGVRMLVDPERLTIQAYPDRVFLHAGRRYRVRSWDSPQQARDRGWIECEREDTFCRTWRIRHSTVFAIRPLAAPVGIGRRGELLTRMAVDLRYEEEVVGALRLTPDLTTGQPPPPETIRLAHPLTQDFETRALVLSFPEPEEHAAASSLCQALRHVLPVHLGVEEDALELVSLSGEMIDQQLTHGLAIVDLYPGGIGLIDAIRDDSSLVLQLLESTRRWLADCACASDQGCERCLRTPAALAANFDQPPQRAAALALLRQIV